MHVIGLDIGTTTLSIVSLDAKTGALLSARTEPNRCALDGSAPYQRAQSPDDIVSACEQLLGEAKGESAAAIGLTGQMHGMLYVDASGRAVSPLFTWQDGRGDQPLAEGETVAQRLSLLTGYPLATGFGSVTHFWHALSRAVPERAAAICSIGDYAGMRLCGRQQPLMHASNAASFGLFNRKACAFDTDAIARASMCPSTFPEVAAGTAVLGTGMGGVPVSVAIGDNQASFLGAVRSSEGSVLVNIGTGAQISVLSSGRSASADVESRPLSGEEDILVGSALCGGRAYALLEGFLRSCASLAGKTPESLYATMNEAASTVLERPSLRVRTAFAGTRARPEMRGAIENIGVDTFTAPELIAGTLHGIADELRWMYETMPGADEPRFLIGSGNGIRKNAALRRVLEMKFGSRLHIPLYEEEAAIGAALFAMAASGVCHSLRDAQRLIRYQGEA